MSFDSIPGTDTSNSYPSVQEADDYFVYRYHASAQWAGLADPAKEGLLISATNLLNWYIKFKGTKTNISQALEWPRTGVTLSDGTPVDVDEIPTKIKHAVFELAFSSLKSDRVADNKLAGMSMLKAGPLQIKAADGGYESTEISTIPEHVHKIVSELVDKSGVGYKRIGRA